LTKESILHFCAFAFFGKYYYYTTKTKQNRSFLATLQGPGPTKRTTFLGHRSPNQKWAIKKLGGTSPTSFCL